MRVPRLRRLALETQIIERYRRRESSVEEALIEMYLAGVSVRRVEDITEALWGTRRYLDMDRLKEDDQEQPASDHEQDRQPEDHEQEGQTAEESILESAG